MTHLTAQLTKDKPPVDAFAGIVFGDVVMELLPILNGIKRDIREAREEIGELKKEVAALKKQSTPSQYLKISQIRNRFYPKQAMKTVRERMEAFERDPTITEDERKHRFRREGKDKRLTVNEAWLTGVVGMGVRG